MNAKIKVFKIMKYAYRNRRKRHLLRLNLICGIINFESQFQFPRKAIDNADILLDDSIRSYIALDEKNQYIIIGRNPTGLLLNMDEIYELKNETVNDVTLLTLQKSF